MTNYEFIKNLRGMKLGTAISTLDCQKDTTKEKMAQHLCLFLPCPICDMYDPEDNPCLSNTPLCYETILKWLNSPVSDIIVLSKLQMLSSEEENAE